MRKGTIEQDGPYLAKLLLNKDYNTIKTVGSNQCAQTKNFKYLGITNEVLYWDYNTPFFDILDILIEDEIRDSND